MKRVSFNVAKAIKEAGFSQEGNAHSTYYDEQHKETFVPFECNRSRDYLAPTYMEVWFWLWEEKKITIDIVALAGGSCGAFIWKFGERLKVQIKFESPEEAITATIEYLVENDLIK